MSKSKKHEINDRATAMGLYIEEIDRFATILRDQQVDIEKLTRQQEEAKAIYDSSREAVREAKDIEHHTVSLLLKFIRPGSIEILPLFDTMEPTNEKIHGQHSTEWRKEPIVSLNLSSIALRAMMDAEIVLVGQLQDRVLNGNDWSKDLGITDGMAQGIEAKLAQFIEERTNPR